MSQHRTIIDLQNQNLIVNYFIKEYSSIFPFSNGFAFKQYQSKKLKNWKHQK